jgi:hypothetical protein
MLLVLLAFASAAKSIWVVPSQAQAIAMKINLRMRQTLLNEAQASSTTLV